MTFTICYDDLLSLILDPVCSNDAHNSITHFLAMPGIHHNISSPFLHFKPVPLHFDLNAPTIITFNGFLKILCQGMEIGAVNSPADGEEEVLKV